MVRKKAFTLLELIVVIIIIGILGSLGFGQYAKIIEKSRVTEAKNILGTIRMAEEGYKLEYNVYTPNMADLYVQAIETCNPIYYFSYKITNTDKDVGFIAEATRCTSGGKIPQATAVYTITLNQNGDWGGTGGIYY